MNFTIFFPFAYMTVYYHYVCTVLRTLIWCSFLGNISSFYIENTQLVQNSFSNRSDVLKKAEKFADDTSLQIRTEAQISIIMHLPQIITNFSWSFPVHTYSYLAMVLKTNLIETLAKVLKIVFTSLTFHTQHRMLCRERFCGV